MKEMSLVEHLEELRTTVIRVGVIVIATFIIAYGLGEYISEILLTPLRSGLGSQDGGQIVYLGLLDKVISQLQLAFWSSILLSSPLWFYEVWRFIKPGIYDHEAKMVRPFLIVGFFLFILGACFAYYVVFPLTFDLLLDFGVKNVQATISLREYIVLSSKALLFFGLAFQLPNVCLILGFMGLVTKYSLKSIRRYVYVGFAAASAFITPPDIVSMVGLWLPLCLLYELGIFAVAIVVHPYLESKHGD
jgi:sec-independent protein translocase protein TatC